MSGSGHREHLTQPQGVRWPRTCSRPALVSLLAYGLLAVVVGEVWPLSRFPMYAHLPVTGAVPVVEVEGAWVVPEDLTAFHGCSGPQIRIPSGVPHRVGWRLDEIARWVKAHSATSPGPVQVRFGYRVVQVTDQGPRLDDNFVELCAGTASWRP